MDVATFVVGAAVAGAVGAATDGSVVNVALVVVNHGGHATFSDSTVTFRQGSHTVRASLDTSGRANAAVATGTWEIGCEGPNVYCPPVGRMIKDSKIAIDAFGLTEVSAAVVAPATSDLPGRLAVQGIFSLLENRGSKQTFEYRTQAAVRGGRATFRIPTARHDLRLGAEGFAPTYRWGLDIAQGKHDLGQLLLRPGSSLFGVAFEPGTDAPAEGVDLRLEPLAPTGVGLSAKLLGTTARTSDRGIFQMTGIAPSRYRLVLLRRGKEVGRLTPIEIPPNSEVRIDAVRLTSPVTAQLRLTPVRTLGEEPWQVTLRQLSPDLLGVPLDLSAKSSALGEVTFSSLPVGPYNLYVRDEKGSRLFFEKIDLSADLDRSIDLPISIVQGRIRLGSNALKARVSLGSGDSDEATFDSDDQGRFEGAMRTPTRGVLFATIESTDPLFSRRLVFKTAKIDVDRHTVDADIVLEDKVIEGRVTAMNGTGIPGLSVTAVADQLSMIETTSRPDGSFELRPASSGIYAVSLRRAGKGVGKTQMVDLTTKDRAHLDMSIGPYRKGQVRLLSAEGEGVPAARLYVKPVGYAGLTLQTDVTGSAEMAWPLGVARGFVSATSIGAPSASLCVDIADPTNPDPNADVEILINLPPQPGTRIRVNIEKNSASSTQEVITEDELFIVSRSGGVWRRSEVENLNAAGGLPAGEYAALWNRGAFVSLLDKWCSGGPPAGLRWTVLGAGQEVTLQVAPPNKRPALGK